MKKAILFFAHVAAAMTASRLRVFSRPAVLLFTTIFLVITLCGCGTDDDDDYDSGKQTTTSSSITSPKLEKYLSTTDTDGFSLRARFSNGGDVTSNMKCVVHWKSYSSKPSSKPKASALTKSETMRVYSSTSRSTTFDKSHAGYKGGTYIYYYFVCRNSKHSVTTDVTYEIVKR